VRRVRLAAVAASLVLAACGGDAGGDGARSALPIDEVRPAIAAVEAALGGPQVYSEVNVTPSEVNVFVVRSGTDLPYVVSDGVVDAPTSGMPYDGPTFSAGEVAFEDEVLEAVSRELPESQIVAFSVTPRPSGGVDYIVTVRGRAAELRVLVDAAGTVLSTG